MTIRLSPTARRLSGVLAVAVVALIAAGVSLGSASSSKVKSPLYNHRDSCTADPATNPVGTATFTRTKNTLTLKVSFHGGEPGSYHLYLYTGDCGTSWTLGKFKVDASGDGSKTGSVNVAGYGDSFFAAPYNDTVGEWNESDIVNV